jgi:hypothetical protein
MRIALRHLVNNTNARILAQWILLSAWALLLTLVLTFGANKVEVKYLKNYPFFFDPMAYDYVNVRLFHLIQESGRMHVALNEFLTNDRNPFRTVPLILFMPKLLSKHSGHLATSVPLLFSFLLLFSHRIWRKSKSFLLAAAVTTLFCATPTFLDVTYGFGANWLDLPSCLAMGAAVICLINAFESQPNVWLAFFGMFASITALSRYAAAFYLGFYAAPVVLWFLIRTYMLNKGGWNSLVKPICTLLFTTILAIWFVLKFLWQNFNYYHKFGYAMDGTVDRSLHDMFETLYFLFHPSLLGLLAACFVIEICVLAKTKSKSSIPEFVFVVWFPLSLFLFLGPILRTIGSIHPLVYFIPAFFICVFGTDAYAKLTKKTIALTSMSLLIFAVYAAANSYHENYKLARNPNLARQIRKHVDQVFAGCIANSKAKYYAEFDFESWAPSLESFYTYGWLPAPQGYAFSIHEAYLKGHYPGLNPVEVATRIYQTQRKDTQMIMVHANTDDIFKNPKIDNNYSRAVSMYFSEHAPKDSCWKFVNSVNSEFGQLNIYKNVSQKL